MAPVNSATSKLSRSREPAASAAAADGSAKPCPTCRGAGAVEQSRKLTVRVPAGIATGQRLRLAGDGEAGTQGGPPGDLYVVIIVQEHSFFRRDGNDLACEIPVNFTTLALGGEIKVPSVSGETADVENSGWHRHRIDLSVARQGHARRLGRGPPISS